MHIFFKKNEETIMIKENIFAIKERSKIMNKQQIQKGGTRRRASGPGAQGGRGRTGNGKHPQFETLFSKGCNIDLCSLNHSLLVSSLSDSHFE